jgi:hypothetical protein
MGYMEYIWDKLWIYGIYGYMDVWLNLWEIGKLG